MDTNQIHKMLGYLKNDSNISLDFKFYLAAAVVDSIKGLQYADANGKLQPAIDIDDQMSFYAPYKWGRNEQAHPPTWRDTATSFIDDRYYNFLKLRYQQWCECKEKYTNAQAKQQYFDLSFACASNKKYLSRCAKQEFTDFADQVQKLPTKDRKFLTQIHAMLIYGQRSPLAIPDEDKSSYRAQLELEIGKESKKSSVAAVQAQLEKNADNPYLALFYDIATNTNWKHPKLEKFLDEIDINYIGTHLHELKPKSVAVLTEIHALCRLLENAPVANPTEKTEEDPHNINLNPLPYFKQLYLCQTKLRDHDPKHLQSLLDAHKQTDAYTLYETLIQQSEVVKEALVKALRAPDTAPSTTHAMAALKI